MTHPQSLLANPLLTEWTGAFGLPPFESITPEHFRPAFDRALAEHRAEIDAIAADKAPPSFDNTIVALEKSGQLLDRISNMFFVLAGAHTSDEIEAVERDISPLLARHSNALHLNRALYARIADLCAPGLHSTSRRRIGLPASTRNWRASAPSSGRTCLRTRSSMRWCWRRVISLACRISRGLPRAQWLRSAATLANMRSRWRAHPARVSCSFHRGAISVKRSSMPGSRAAKMAAQPTIAR